MKRNLGWFLQSLSRIAFVLIGIVTVFVFPFDFRTSLIITIASFFAILPMYTMGEIVNKLDEGVDVLNEILNKLDNSKSD